MDPELPLLAPERRARRSWSQRVLLGVGAVCTAFAIVAAAVVGWGAWKVHSIDRTDVALDELIAGGPANYLIVGSDSRRGGDPLDPTAANDHQPLADTIMLLRIDPATKTARMLSLPRDLWLTLAASGKKGRVNAAYAHGPQELVDTLRTELDVPINHYVEVDFQGFQQIVTAVDGVPMWFDRAMRDRNTGLDVLHPGCITLDGRNALAFARSRHLEYFRNGGFTYDGTGDLGRISRQQLFLRRVIDRAKRKGISNPLTLKRLVDASTANVTIDGGLSLSELLALGRRFSSFDSNALQTYTLPNTPRTTDGGAQVVELDANAAAPILDLFRPSVAASPTSDAATGNPGVTGSTGATTTTLLAPSAVKATVLNSSGQSGLAVQAADALVAQGFAVAHFGNGAELAHPTESKTVVRYGTGGGDAAQSLAAHVSASVRTVADSSLDHGQVVLFLGDDFTGLADATSSKSSATGSSGSTTTTVAPTTSTTVPPQSKVVGMIPGDPPAGTSCG